MMGLVVLAGGAVVAGQQDADFLSSTCVELFQDRGDSDSS